MLDKRLRRVKLSHDSRLTPRAELAGSRTLCALKAPRRVNSAALCRLTRGGCSPAKGAELRMTRGTHAFAGVIFKGEERERG